MCAIGRAARVGASLTLPQVGELHVRALVLRDKPVQRMAQGFLDLARGFLQTQLDPRSAMPPVAADGDEVRKPVA